MKLNAAAWTSTSTSPGPGTGSASSPSSSASMPSKRLQMTARISAQPLHTYRDDFGRRAFQRTLSHAAGHHRLALPLRDDSRTQLERLRHQRRLEVADLQ